MTARTKTQTDTLPLQKAGVTSLSAIGREVFVLRIPRYADFIPGQVIGITTTPSIPPRLFSLCSGNNDPYWEILFNIKHDGLLSPQLANLQTNQEIYF
ncbi:MAG: hypothetical protein ACNA71_03285 [Kiritimatiellia bacterium]